MFFESLQFTVYSLRFTVYGLQFTVYGLRFRKQIFRDRLIGAREENADAPWRRIRWWLWLLKISAQS